MNLNWYALGNNLRYVYNNNKKRNPVWGWL